MVSFGAQSLSPQRHICPQTPIAPKAKNKNFTNTNIWISYNILCKKDQSFNFFQLFKNMKSTLGLEAIQILTAGHGAKREGNNGRLWKVSVLKTLFSNGRASFISGNLQRSTVLQVTSPEELQIISLAKTVNHSARVIGFSLPFQIFSTFYIDPVFCVLCRLTVGPLVPLGDHPSSCWLVGTRADKTQTPLCSDVCL